MFLEKQGTSRPNRGTLFPGNMQLSLPLVPLFVLFSHIILLVATVAIVTSDDVDDVDYGDN